MQFEDSKNEASKKKLSKRIDNLVVFKKQKNMVAMKTIRFDGHSGGK